MAGLSASDKTLLMLNNNRAAALRATLTVYANDGTSQVLPVVELKASQSLLLRLNGLLGDAHLFGSIGYVEVSYEGILMELGAQLTLYPMLDRGGLDSPRSLSVDFASTSRSAIAWLPAQSKAVVAVSNVTETAYMATINMNGRASKLALGPHETVLKSFRAQGEDGEDQSFAADVSFDGPKDAIRTFGYIESNSTGSLPIRFYDPAAATQNSISAPGLLTRVMAHVVARNLSAHAIRVLPHWSEVGSQKPRSADGFPVIIPPGAAVSVPLDGMKAILNKGVERATLTLGTDAPKGALIGAVTEEVEDSVLEDVPLRAGNPLQFMRGYYPLRWERDYKNLPMISNTSDVEQSVYASVVTGGKTYVFPITKIDPGTTAVFDVDSIRANKTPDNNGDIMPTDTLFGKFHWNSVVYSNTVGLIGRTELRSTEDKRASSFSCGGTCSYLSFQSPFFDGDPGGTYPQPYQTAAKNLTAQNMMQDPYGNPIWYTNISTQSMGGLAVDNTYILTANPQSNGYVMQEDTQVPGGTNIGWYFTQVVAVYYDDTTPCGYIDNGYAQSEPIAVQPTVTITSSPANANSVPVGGTITLTANPNPPGGSFQWSASNANVSLSNPTSQTVTVQGAAQGQASVTISYNLNGQSGTASLNIMSQQARYFIPTSATSVQGGCFSPSVGSFYDVAYYVGDQDSNRISVAGMTPLETAPGAVNQPFSSPSSTSASGSFDDYPVGTCFTFPQGTPPNTQACTDVGQTFEIRIPNTSNGTSTDQAISTSTVRRDCALGQRITIQGNPGGSVIYTQGVVN